MTLATKKCLGVIFVISVLIVIVNPFGLLGTHMKAGQPCWNNLMRIEGAKQQWALENKAKAGDLVTLENILPYLGRTQCNVPNGKYVVGKMGEDPKCTVHGTMSNFKPDHY